MSAGLLTWREGAYPLPAIGLRCAQACCRATKVPYLSQVCRAISDMPMRLTIAAWFSPCCSQGGHPTEPIIAVGLARLMDDVAMMRRALLKGLREWEADDQAFLPPARSKADQRRASRDEMK